MSWPKTFCAWRRSKAPYPLHLVLSTETLPEKLGAHDVLMRVHAVSLNYRDFAMLEQGKYPIPVEEHGISASDCATEVIAVGSEVSDFVVGDRVAPTIDLLNLTGKERLEEDLPLGGRGPGVLAEYVIFDEKVLVKLPGYLSWEESATLPGAGVTAWVSLDGLKDVPPNASALLQGTGGVSIATLHLCIAAGIKPIITSSSDEKIAKLKKLSPLVEGVNYRTSADLNGDILKLTEEGRGVDYIINNIGLSSLPNDLKVIRKQGRIALVGFLGGTEADFPPAILFNLIFKAVRLQGILGASKKVLEEQNHWLGEKEVGLSGLVDRVFNFDDAPAAYEYLKSGQHIGKVVIKF